MSKVTEIKQESIICAALKIFAEKGLEQASMEAIAKQAEVSKRTLYKYYPTKESLFCVIIERLLSKITVMRQIRFEPEQPLDTQLLSIARKEADLLSNPDFQCLAKVVIMECLRSSDIGELMMEKVEKLEGGCGLSRWIRDGLEAGRLDVPCPEIVAEQFISGLKAVVFWPQLMTNRTASEEEKNAAIHSVVKQFISAYAIKE